MCIRLENSCCWARSALVIRVDAVELTQQALQLGAIPQRDDGAELAPLQEHRHVVDDEHVLVGEHDLVAPSRFTGEQRSPAVPRAPATPALARRPAPGASASSRRASSLASVITPELSSVITPSRIPCSIASRSWTSAAISSSSRPKVLRLSRRASVTEATTPMPSASAK